MPRLDRLQDGEAFVCCQWANRGVGLGEGKVFLFLGSPRSVMVPVVTIPLSQIGVALFMLMMGYSINLLTLLAMVMARVV